MNIRSKAKFIKTYCIVIGCVAVLTIMFAANKASATVIYDNGLGQNNTVSGYFSSQLRNWRVYDDFQIGTSASIDNVFFQMGLTRKLTSVVTRTGDTCPDAFIILITNRRN